MKAPERKVEPRFTALPAGGPGRPAPKWPDGKPSPDEARLWADLWARPIAWWWWEQRIPPVVVARYVRQTVLDRDEPKLKLGLALSRLERDLGLTPEALEKLRLTVEPSESKKPRRKSAYAHLKADD